MHPCQLCWPDGPRVSCLIRSGWVAQRPDRRAVLHAGAGRVAPGDPPLLPSSRCDVHLWTTAAWAAVGIPLSSAALGMPRERSDRWSGRAERAGGTCRLCRPTVPRSAAERASEASVRRTTVARFPYALSFLAALHTVPRLERKRKPGTSGETACTPWTRTPSLHPRSGCTGHDVSPGHRTIWLYSTLADRGNAVRVPLPLPREARAGTRTGPLPKRQRRRAQPGASHFAPCCRRRFSRGAQRSSHSATSSRQAVENSVVPAPGQHRGAVIASTVMHRSARRPQHLMPPPSQRRRSGPRLAPRPRPGAPVLRSQGTRIRAGSMHHVALARRPARCSWAQQKRRSPERDRR